MRLKTSKKKKVFTISNSTKTHISKQKKRQHYCSLKKHLRGGKYISKPKKTAFLCAQKTSKKNCLFTFYASKNLKEELFAFYAFYRRLRRIVCLLFMLFMS